MGRVISVTLPLGPIDRLRRGAPDATPSQEAPLVLTVIVGNRRLVTAACALAQALWVNKNPPGFPCRAALVRNGR